MPNEVAENEHKVLVTVSVIVHYHAFLPHKSSITFCLIQLCNKQILGMILLDFSANTLENLACSLL